MISTSMRLGRQLTLAVFLFAGTMCARANDPVFLPGFRVGLVPATSKLRPSQFGFEEFLGARVLIVELQAALHTRITNEYGPIGLQRLGATVESYEALKVGDADGYLARGRLAADGTQIWSFVFRSTDLAAVVLVRVPRSVSHTYSDAVVRKMLDSIAVRGKLSIEDQVAALGYRIGDPAGFRVAGARAGGGVTLTEGPHR